MGIFGKFFKVAASEDEDLGAIRNALNIYKNYKKREAEASEAERKEAEEALAFLRQNDQDPT